MTKLDLNTEELREAAKKFKIEASEMEDAVASADTTFGPCRGHVSKKVSSSVEEWDAIKSGFQKQLEALVNAADKLVNSAEVFETADD
ncbi:MAG: hypothetical protein PWP52_360 [Bacteroidales bacterium]|nr:hypothetical protein [Bacteroidales bacterium]